MTSNSHSTQKEVRSRERRLDRAIEYVSDYWFPVNAARLEQIQDDIRAGKFDTDCNALVSEIKSDFSLFTYCLKKLVSMLKAEGAHIPATTTPLELLERAELTRLTQILQIDDHDISRHSLDMGDELQFARLRETLLSASTAEVLAHKYALDPELAYSAALLRQLGHTLIAWNYPGVYADAMLSHRQGEELDQVLARLLGFSPQLLAVRLLNRWGLSTENCANFGMLDAEDLEEHGIINAIGTSLSQLCKIGESLARANDPERYPRAKDEWETTRKEIESKLGPAGMALIREKFEQNSESYLTNIPHIFKAGLIVELREIHEETSLDSVTQRNPWIVRCNQHVEHTLRELYEQIDVVHQDITGNLRTLVKEIIPEVGFTGGCIFSLDPALMLLMPQTEVGQMELRSARAVDYSIVRSDADIVAVAYQSAEPVVAYKKTELGAALTAIAGHFGKSNRVGVLYLEIPDMVENTPDSPALVHFKALRLALNDCLGLS